MQIRLPLILAAAGFFFVPATPLTAADDTPLKQAPADANETVRLTIVTAAGGG